MVKKILFALTLLIVFAFVTFTVYADIPLKYSVRDWRISAVINPDGSMDVEEYITYDVSRSHEGPVVRHVDIAHSSSMENLEVFSVTQMATEDSGQSQLEPYEFVDKPNQNMSKVYTVKPGASPDEVQEVLIYLPPDSNKQTIVLRYRLNDLVFLYRDTAVLYWNPVIMGYGCNIGNIDLRVTLPQGTEAEDIKPFVYGALSGNCEVLDDGTVSITGQRLKTQEFMEVTLAFPKDVVGQGRKLIDNDGLERILEEQQVKMEEMELLRHKKEQEQKLRMAAIAGMAAGVVAIGVCVWVWVNRYRFRKGAKKQPKEHPALPSLNVFARLRQLMTANKARSRRETTSAELAGPVETDKPEQQSDMPIVDLPADYYTPAELSVLLHGEKIKPRDMVATLIDLAVRRYLDVEAIEIDNDKCYVLSLRDFEPTGLKPHEEYLVNWFFKDIGNEARVSTKAILQAAYGMGFDSHFYNKFIIWKKLVLKQAARWKFNKRLTPFKLYRRTSFGQQHYDAWIEFKKALKRLSAQADSIPIADWERFFAYAFSLGIARHVVKGLKKAFPEGTPHDDDLAVFSGYNFVAIDHWFDLAKRFDIVWVRLFRSISRFAVVPLNVGQNRKKSM